MSFIDTDLLCGFAGAALGIGLVVVCFVAFFGTALVGLATSPGIHARWPAGTIREALPPLPGAHGPFRDGAAENTRVVRSVAAGVPRALLVAAFCPSVLAFVWLVGFGLSLRELLAGAAFFCLLRSLLGGATISAVFARQKHADLALLAASFALDAALFAFPILVSDRRSDDRFVALLGLASTLLLAGNYALVLLRRRRLVPLEVTTDHAGEADEGIERVEVVDES